MVAMSERTRDQAPLDEAGSADAPAGDARAPGGVREPGGAPMDAYDYGLPDAAIAQHPVEPRSAARLLVGPGLRDNRGPEHATMADLPTILRRGDALVVNDTRVLAARLRLVKATGGGAEVLLLEPRETGSDEWEALVRPGRRLPASTLLYEAVAGPPVLEVGEPLGGWEAGRRRVRLLDPAVVERAGTMPLPPYIHRALSDPDRYQTVYSGVRDPGDRSAAAPTAGLHFTPQLLEACVSAGARLARVDLAIGLDTFRPITAPTPGEHVIHSERYSVPSETMAVCREAERVVAVGTTAVRALESAAATGRLSGRTNLYIHGDFPFRMVDVLVTNFHLPRSSLLLLVESFCGPVWRDLYGTALADGYRFLSFGDAMVVERRGGPAGPWSPDTRGNAR
jgi:S-adenosylmethionine:tRNA ribosyltransferase-isomerase